MQVDWRRLLDDIRVPWRDRGANCSRNNINIRCPWCSNDPSEHLRISETREAFFCLREPRQHSGANFRWLLRGLHVSSTEAELLLQKYSHQGYQPAAPEPEPEPLSAIQMRWDRFVPADSSESMLEYVRRRGFPNPRDTITRYGLRWAPEGTWAQRLLIPFTDFTDRAQVLAWTGRAIREGLRPRYKAMESLTGGTPLFAPDLDYESKQVLVVMEGPMDALALSDSLRRSPHGAHIGVAAMAGKQLTAGKLLAVRALAAHCSTLLLAADADVSVVSANSMLTDLAFASKTQYNRRARLPEGYKDPAEIPTEERLPWILECLAQIRAPSVV